MTPTRRHALSRFARFLAASPLAAVPMRAQRDRPDEKDRYPRLEEMVNVFDLEPICRSKLSKERWDFVAGGVDNEWTLRRNREAFDKFQIRPRMMVNTSRLDLSCQLFGDTVGSPILIAPTGSQQLTHADGELAMARAAAARKTIMVLSTASSYPYDQVMSAAKAPKWFQLYPGPDLEGTWERVERAVDLGFKTICLTADTPWGSHRERLLRDGLAAGSEVPRPAGQTAPTEPPPRRRRAEEPQAPTNPYRATLRFTGQLDWSFVDELKKRAKVPVLIKGILTGEDAELARQHGCDGVMVSNHGGRYLDYAPAPVEVLSEVVQAVGGRIPVIVDGGFRRGTDILKALALGAQAVMVGRPTLWGLGAFGEAGAVKVLELLETELATAMGLAGAPNVKALNPKFIRPA